MSSPRPDLPNSASAALKVLELYTQSDKVVKVYLVGSRSPLRKKQPTETSDWDFVFITSVPNFRVQSLRESGLLHGDISYFHGEDRLKRTDLAEVYPNDPYEVFK